MKSKLNHMLLGFALAVAVIASMGAVSWTPSGGTYNIIGGTTNKVSAPSIVSTTSATTAFAATAASGAYEQRRIRIMQNVGTVPVLYCLGGTASVTNYHGVLAPGTAARDGYGSLLDISDWRGSVGIAVESGTGVVATVEVIAGR